MQPLFFCMWLCLGFAVINESVGAPQETLRTTVLTKDDYGQFVPVAGADPFAALGTILHLDTNHLVALGIGIVVGATLIAPELNLGELTGIIVGVIVGDLLYRVALTPKKVKSHSWFFD